MGGPEKGRLEKVSFLCAFATDTSGELYVLGHNGDPLGVDGAQVGVFEESYQVSLGSLLEGHDSRRLEAKIGLEVLCNFADQPLEGEFSDQKFRRFLVTTDFSQSNRTWSVSVGLLNTTSGRCRFSGGLGGELFSWSLSSC